MPGLQRAAKVIAREICNLMMTRAKSRLKEKLGENADDAPRWDSCCKGLDPVRYEEATKGVNNSMEC